MYYSTRGCTQLWVSGVGAVRESRLTEVFGLLDHNRESDLFSRWVRNQLPSTFDRLGISDLERPFVGSE